MASASSSARIRASAPTAGDPAPTGSAVRSRWFLGRLPFALVLALPPVLGGVLGVLSARSLSSGPFDAGRALLYTAAGVGFWVAALWWLIWRLSRAFQSLERVSMRVAGGDYSPVEIDQMPTSRLVALQGSLTQMVAHLQEAHGALERQMHQERRMRKELESLQQQVIRQERLAAVGMLVSGVAHEINNPLQAILGFAELLQMQHSLPEAVNHDLALIQRESARACGIIRNLALFARQQPGQSTVTSLASIIASVSELRLRRLQSEDIELLVDDQATRSVMAVFTELQQVVLNLVINAEQVIMGSGRLPGRVTVRTCDVGQRVLLEVEDTGTGVEPENEAKLFQPFFTTKSVGEGTGLGLSVSYGIIVSMGGTMGYRKAPAGGAIFYFELPAAPAA